MRGGWDLDALGKFFRRRRRRRRPRPLILRQILEQNRHAQSFLMENDILGHVLFRRSFLDLMILLCRTRRQELGIFFQVVPT